MNLLTAEAKRLAWRPFVRITALVVLLLGVGFTLLTTTSPTSPGVRRWPVSLEPYLYSAPLLACFGAGMIGATSIGAEFSSGSLTQWLTFNPRRSRVYGAKLAVVAVASALLGAVTSVAMVATAVLVAVLSGRTVQVGVAHPGGVLLRGLAFVVLLGVAGFALASLFGHTAAAPAAAAAWFLLALVAAMLGSQSIPAAILSPEFVIAALLEGTYSRRVLVGPQTYEQVTMHWPMALALVVSLVGALALASWVRFTRRDVI